MINARKTLAIAMLAWLVCGGARWAGAQDKDKKEDSTKSAPVAYRLDYAISEMEDGKKVNTRQYSANLNVGDANNIKIGARIPVEPKNGEFQYLDIGTNIWNRLLERSDSLILEVRCEVSSLAAADQQGQQSRPVVRQVQINASTVVLPGKPMILGTVDDPMSKRQFQLETTVTKLR